MKYIQRLGISKNKLFPLGVLVTSLCMSNSEAGAKIHPSYATYTCTSSFMIPSLLRDKQSLPREYPTPQLYYASLPDYTSTPFVIDVKAINPLPLSRASDYITLSGGKPGETSGAVNLDSNDGLKAYNIKIEGDVSTSDSAGKLITVKETTITGAITLGDGNNTIMLDYSETGQESTTTIQFTNPNDTSKQDTKTVTSGSGGDIKAGNGDNVVWIGGAPKEGFGWSGHGTGSDGRSTIYGSIILGNGNNELKIYGDSKVHGNITLGDGNNSLSLENVDIGLIVKDTYTDEFATVPGLSSNGNITLGTGKNTIDIQRTEIAGSISSGSGNDSMHIVSSSIYGDVKVQGAGSNTVKIEYTTVYGGITVEGEKNSIEVRGGFIGKPKPYNNDTATATYKDIKMGSSDNTLRLYYLTFSGEIEGNGTIGLHAGATWKKDTISIKSGQEVHVYASGQMEGNVLFDNNSQTLYLYGGEINGTVGNSSSAIGSIFIRDEQSDDFVSANLSVLRGDVYAETLDIAKGTGVRIEPLELSPNDTNSVRWEDTIGRVLDIDSIKLAGDILLHQGVVGDNLTIKGEINPLGGSFILDMNFEEGTSDVLNLNDATILNTTGGANSIVYFVPEKPLYYATLGTVIEGVVLGNSSLSVALTHSDVGGYEYELILNPNQTQWDLRLVRISASNYAYAGILENMRNYTQHLWTSLNNHFMQSMVAQHGEAFSIVPNISTNKRLFKEVGITVWANVNYVTNTIYDPSAPTIDEETFIVSAGISTEGIRINEDNNIALHVFSSYGSTDSKLNQYERNHTMQMNALSLGVLATWNYKGLGEKHTLFTTAGSWLNMIHNKVNLEGLDHNTRWETYSVQGVASFGYQLQEGSVIFLTSLDSIYSFTRGVSFITRTNNAIDIQDDHQFSLRWNALVGYSFNFGVTPFFQVMMDFPVYASNDGVIRSNGYAFRYDTENFTTGFNVGVNYTMAFGEDNLRAYCIVGIHKGQPSSTVEVGFMVSGGISYTF